MSNYITGRNIAQDQRNHYKRRAVITTTLLRIYGPTILLHLIDAVHNLNSLRSLVGLAGSVPGHACTSQTVDADLSHGALQRVADIRVTHISRLDKVDVCTVKGADRAITSFDGAIAKVSEVRSSIGAYQNRLDYAVSSLDGTELNMTQALSRIEDVDMAEEMTEYTKFNVLTQAATSVLAQANDLPQQVLQLLQ